MRPLRSLPGRALLALSAVGLLRHHGEGSSVGLLLQTTVCVRIFSLMIMLFRLIRENLPASDIARKETNAEEKLEELSSNCATTRKAALVAGADPAAPESAKSFVMVNLDIVNSLLRLTKCCFDSQDDIQRAMKRRHTGQMHADYVPGGY
ncbi:hypothetical protein HPB47_022989 [Ixodes persulcatus]|uniref:Uncharacterized protein n=1 Tax=Ixodes persulcatus TaxID=34615 RepID=A0AC60Q9C1_IXOPE|nr:hypothetical protein HPB47_022989 [Ixodes persulcatus]